MKLDNLTPDELKAYENWYSADYQGGDCQTIGYAWAAWRYSGMAGFTGIVITEDDQGFVYAETYESEYDFDMQVKTLIARDEEFYREDMGDLIG